MWRSRDLVVEDALVAASLARVRAGLASERRLTFDALRELSEEQFASHHVREMLVQRTPGFECFNGVDATGWSSHIRGTRLGRNQLGIWGGLTGAEPRARPIR